MSAVVLLALCSAITYGLSDFVGGVLTRRANVWAVAAASQAAATVLTLGLLVTNMGAPDPRHLWLGVLAGLGTGAGNVFIYRGLAAGRMMVVAPLSAIAAAVLPVVVGSLIGDRPGTRPLIGVLVAMPAIWLVSGGRFGLGDARRSDVVNGIAAGLGFGVQFSSLGLVPHQAGLVPLAVCQAVSVIAIVLGAVACSAPWIPRDRFSQLGTAAGLLAGTATACFQFAVQSGMLTIAAVLASLYPAVTVLLAAVVLRERIQRTQGAGLALAMIAVALIVAGS
jgi:uncharacterized membrane protein